MISLRLYKVQAIQTEFHCVNAMEKSSKYPSVPGTIPQGCEFTLASRGIYIVAIKAIVSHKLAFLIEYLYSATTQKGFRNFRNFAGMYKCFCCPWKIKATKQDLQLRFKNNHFVDVAKSHLFITAINLFLFFIHLFLYMQKSHYVNEKNNRANCFHSSIKHDTSGNIPHWSEFRPCPHVYGYSSIHILHIQISFWKTIPNSQTSMAGQ